MEQSNISLRYGIHRSPHIAEDGEMMECINVYPRDGEMVNIPLMEEEGEVSGVLMYVHRNSGYVNYISYNRSSGKIEWRAESDTSTTILEDNTYSKEPLQVIAVGNTLEVLAEDGIHYYLYEGGSYRFLGSNIPDVQINFSLEGDIERVFDTRHPSNVDVDVETKMKSLRVKTTIMEKNAEWMEDGYFTQPFFVRYALRLTNGHTNHSAPVLMTPSTLNPLVLASGNRLMDNKDAISDIWVYMVKARLQYLIAQGAKEQLSSWSDVVQGIDIFVSSPIYTYDQEKDYDRSVCLYGTQGYTMPAEEEMQVLGWSMLSTTKQNAQYTLSQKSAKRSMYGLSQLRYPGEANTHPNLYVYRGIEKEDSYIKSEIETCGNFYLLKSLPLSDLIENERVTMSDFGFDLMDISVRGRLKDDYLSHDKITATQALSYNSRLTLSGVSITKEAYFTPEEMVQFAEAEVLLAYDDNGNISDRSSSSNNPLPMTMDVLIEVDGKEVWLRKVGTLPISYETSYPYIFYPDTAAKRIRLWVNAGEREHIRVQEFTLKTHELLNGSYAFKGFGDIKGAVLAEEPTASEGSVTVKDSDIYTSEVDNPFIFPASYRLRVGNGEVQRLAVSYRAMSMAQFGQFPLVAFATDGIWSIPINNDGTYGIPTPVSSMVCGNIKSITAVEDVIYFADSRGLFSINGSQLSLHSRPIEGYVGYVNDFAKKTDWESVVSTDNREIREVLRDCSLVYDNKHRLLHIYPSAVSGVTYKHYVLCMDNGEFVTAVDKMGAPDRVVVKAPYDVIQIGSKLYNFDSSYSTEARRGVMLSRDLTLGNPLARKVITALRLYQSAVDTAGRDFKMAIYASDDKVNWIMLSSVRGHSFKYYRIAIFTLMTDIDAVSGVTIMHEERYSNRV